MFALKNMKISFSFISLLPFSLNSSFYRSMLFSKLGLECKKRLAKHLVCNIALHEMEAWTLRKEDFRGLGDSGCAGEEKD